MWKKHLAGDSMWAAVPTVPLVLDPQVPRNNGKSNGKDTLLHLPKWKREHFKLGNCEIAFAEYFRCIPSGLISLLFTSQNCFEE